MDTHGGNGGELWMSIGIGVLVLSCKGNLKQEEMSVIEPKYSVIFAWSTIAWSEKLKLKNLTRKISRNIETVKSPSEMDKLAKSSSRIVFGVLKNMFWSAEAMSAWNSTPFDFLPSTLGFISNWNEESGWVRPKFAVRNGERHKQLGLFFSVWIAKTKKAENKASTKNLANM